jgi:hypothetical protein
MENLNYSAGLVSKLLWFKELKKTATLLKQFSNKEDIKKIAIDENIYQMNNVSRAVRIFNYSVKRLESIDAQFNDIFIQSDIDDAKIIALVTIMKVEKIVFDFVYEVYRKKIILGEQEIRDSDIDMFFEYKRTQYIEMENWSQETNSKMKQTILKMLLEAGLIKQEDGAKKIQKVLLGYELESYLINYLEVFYNAIMGGN